jgi:hypothetical protein
VGGGGGGSGGGGGAASLCRGATDTRSAGNAYVCGPGGLYNPGASKGASTDRLVPRLPELGPLLGPRARARARHPRPSLSLAPAVPATPHPPAPPRRPSPSACPTTLRPLERAPDRARGSKREGERVGRPGRATPVARGGGGRSGAEPRLDRPSVCHGAKSGNDGKRFPGRQNSIFLLRETLRRSERQRLLSRSDGPASPATSSSQPRVAREARAPPEPRVSSRSRRTRFGQ